ncbi:ankyrin repeat protein, putative [Trichomonas vaginalis G3]|uniref:Ankyrin repeat protein, putative n=1 Tax=Trichomonas vaginalis (strain ATCC PRA-98 / G3) TaxID=412133 RepID=A2G5G8_TRIV3|nr:nerve growth factor signaling pathway [Trichomonas vaginalis G3]EAX87595.1 ankyrin repeat protein, putative [Trichomonas vaginalis G3]KAI5532392.1 nerve growth factor signaling pathway [Trichomonas vaginalis G3]|eukprot:XP_001300525.1 ankyrin repeat protein [Trichomonas vaginalis G3]
MSDFAYKNSKIQDILEIYDKSSILHSIFQDNAQKLAKFANATNFDVDTSIEGNNLIDHCAFYGSVECFRFLVCNQAKVTMKTLENACLGGDNEIIQFCEQKFLPNMRCINNSVVAHHNDIANYLQSKYDLEYSWSKCTFSYNIEMFLAKLCSIKEINSPDNGGFIAFPSAARFCIPSLINLLISKGANIKSRDFNKLTALDHCCILDSLDICKLLIDNKMDVEDTSIYKITPLTYCSANDSYEVAKFLIEQCHANVNARDVIGSTPLIYASEGNSVKVAQLLIENGASVDDEDEFSKTPLMACAQYDSVDVAKILIEKGAFIEKTDKFNQTVLMKCAMSDACKLTKLLIEKRANIEAVDVNKYDALMISVDCDSKNVEKLLREYKKDYKIKVL